MRIAYILIFMTISLPALSTINIAPSLDAETLAPYEEKLVDLQGKELILRIRKITSRTRQNKPNIALHYFNVALKLLESTPNDKIKIDLYHNAAWAYITLGDFNNAKEYGQLCLKLGEEINYLRGKSHGATVLGAISTYRGDIITALRYNKESLAYSRQGNDKFNIASGVGNLANIYYSLGDSNTALTYMSESRRLNAELRKWKSVATIEMNMAEVYMELNNFKKALPYYLSSLKVHEQSNNTWYIARVKSMLGKAYISQNMFDEAQKQTTESITLFTEIGEKHQIANAHEISGIIYHKKGLYEQAITEFNDALSIANEIQSDLAILTTTQLLADTYLSINRLDKALDYASIALEKTKMTQSKEHAKNTHEILSRIFAARGEHNQAYQHLLKYKQHIIEIKQQEVSDKYEKNEYLYQSAKKERKIDKLMNENYLHALEIESQIYKRNTWVLFFLLLTLITIGFIYRQHQKRKVIAERANLMADLVEKKNQLFADVSHELRTPLTVLQLKVEALQHNLVQDVNASYDSLIVKIGEIDKLIADIYQLAQSDIGSLQINIQPHDAKTTIGQWTLELSDIVQAKGFQWQQHTPLPKSVDLALDYDKIKQVLNNLIANSIAYTDAPGIIKFSTKVTNSHVELRVEDSSPGVNDRDMPRLFERLFRVELSRNKATGGSGLGLSICKNIVEAHGGEISVKASKLGGIAISIKLPITQ